MRIHYRAFLVPHTNGEGVAYIVNDMELAFEFDSFFSSVGFKLNVNFKECAPGSLSFSEQKIAVLDDAHMYRVVGHLMCCEISA